MYVWLFTHTVWAMELKLNTELGLHPVVRAMIRASHTHPRGGGGHKNGVLGSV